MRIKALRAAFPCTLPVFMGYLFLGIAFGVLLAQRGFSPLWALLMSVFIYAGSMQFVTIDLLAAAFSPFSAFLMTIMVNARHLFYGLSMLEPFQNAGRLKPYLIFSLTDETYSLLCGVRPPEGVNKHWFFFFIAALDQLYWITGSCIGAAAGNLIPFDSTGIDFAMTALFLVIFTEQWESAQSHLPALCGIGITVVCRLCFGPDNFLLFSMAGILAALLLLRRQRQAAGTTDPAALAGVPDLTNSSSPTGAPGTSDKCSPAIEMPVHSASQNAAKKENLS